MNNLRYIIYSRKSSEAKEKQALSIAEQNIECNKYSDKEGLKIVKRLEESRSAFKPHNRPEFDTMVALVESKQADAILTWHLNRIARNPEEGGKILQLLQDGVIKEIRTASGEVYTQDSDHLIIQIHLGMANQYSRNISRDVRRSLNQKASRGEYPRPAIVGYTTIGERGSKNLKPHAFEAPLILEIYQMASTGRYSLNYLIKDAYQKGLRTKKGKKISKSHLYCILTSPLYYGYFYHNGELFKGSYKPIVTKELFDAVQKALRNRSKPKTTSWDSNWNGLVFCDKCGCAITTSNKTKHYERTDRTVTYTYLHCTHRRGNCHQPPITQEDFIKELIKYTDKVAIDEEVWSLGMKLLKEKHSHQTEQNSHLRNQYENQYGALQQKLNRLIDMRADGELSKEEFISQKEILLKEQAHVESLITDTKSTEHNWLELTENFLNTVFHAREIMENGEPEEKRNLIMTLGENLKLRDEKLKFSFRQPYDVLLLPEYRTNVLRG